MSRMSIVALVAALVISPAAVQAQSTITACYVPKSGSVYRIKTEGAPSACKSNHVEFSWVSSTSPWGPYTAVEQPMNIQPGETADGVASCPAGRQPISGGFRVVDADAAEVVILGSHEAGTLGTGNVNWQVTARNDGSEMVIMYVHALCATYNP